MQYRTVLISCNHYDHEYALGNLIHRLFKLPIHILSNFFDPADMIEEPMKKPEIKMVRQYKCKMLEMLSRHLRLKNT
jgi:hypothetical protein